MDNSPGTSSSLNTEECDILFQIVEGNLKLKTTLEPKESPDSDSESICSGYSTASTVVIGTKELSCNNDEGDNSIKEKASSSSSDSNFIIIGPNGTRVEKNEYETIEWETPSRASRKLTRLVFDEETLATHTLTGNPSPAFIGRERPPKKKLDPMKTEDIVYSVVHNSFGVNIKYVRSLISSICCESSARLRKKLAKNNKK